MMQKVTISDVAREAGCSKATVSYAINRTGPISDEVRKRVLAVAERLKYHPSATRRGVRERRAIALLIRGDFRVGSEPTFTFNREILARGYVPQIYQCVLEEEPLRATLALIGSDQNVAGVINTVPEIGSLNLLKYCREVPSFIYARNGCMLCSVQCNYVHRMRLALSHLHSLGHCKILFFIDAAIVEKPLMVENIAFLREYCRNNAMEGEIVTHPEGRDNESLFPKLDEARRGGFTAAIVWNEFFATMVYQWAYDRRIRIPDELSVLGFCDEFSAQNFAPMLSSVQIPLEKMVCHTLNALLARIEDREVDEILLHPFLSASDSTGPVLKNH